MTATPSEPLAIGIVTYRPDEAFYARAAAVSAAGHTLFVFDNSPLQTQVERLLTGADAPIHYITAGGNAGLGIGLASLCATAHAYGHPALLFFDQDTAFTQATLSYAADFLRRQSAALLPTHAAVVFAAADAHHASHEPRDVLLAISSGSLFLLPNAQRMGWHDRSFFVDGVDYEFCLRARAHGLRIAMCNGAPGFDHQSEQPDTPRRLLGRTWRLRRYAGRRVFDSLSAYARLIVRTTARFDVVAALALARSAAIFTLGQILARLPLRRAEP